MDAGILTSRSREMLTTLGGLALAMRRPPAGDAADATVDGRVGTRTARRHPWNSPLPSSCWPLGSSWSPAGRPTSGPASRVTTADPDPSGGVAQLHSVAAQPEIVIGLPVQLGGAAEPLAGVDPLRDGHWVGGMKNEALPP